MEMGEQYGRTELEAIVKSTGHHQFLSPLPQPPPPLPPPPPEMHGLSLPEMVVHNPFRLAGFFHAGVFGRQQHPGMMVVGEEEQEEVGHQLQGLVYPQRLDFFSGDSLPTTSTDGPSNAAALSANLLLGGHGSGNHNCGGDGRGGGDNVRRCMSSSPSGKLEEGEGLKGGGDGGNSRWPRHETLTLLELRAQLDSKFREATQKGPLWEELSREMAEGYGYHRSGKKCREKFENLYKYYKKTKEGRTGRQDGKLYRFYAQLEALCGGGDGKTSNNTNTSNMNSSANSDFDLEEHNGGLETMSTGKKLVSEEKNAGMAIPGFDIATSSGWSEEEELGTEDEKGKTQKKKKKESWKWKMKAYMEKQMKRLMDRQEEWFEKVLKTIERKEEERLAREEAWRREEGERLHREHEFWAKERAWIEARDATFMEAMRKVVGVQDCSTRAPLSPSASFDVQDLQEETCCNNNMSEGSSRPKCDMLNLVRLRAAMEGRLQEGGPKAQ